MVAESGFQGGAIRVAQNANITLTSLEDLRANTATERAQAEISAFTSRTGELAEDARRLWAWAPPSAPSGPIATDAIVEFAATAFEFDSMALPKIARGSYPITLSMGGHFVAQDAAELKPVLLARLEAAEQEAHGYWTLAQAAAQRALTLVDNFTNTIDELIAAGRAFDAELHEGAPARFVPAMRAVSDAAEALMPLVPTHVRSGVVAVMRWLTDNAYAVTESTRPDWDRVETTLTRFLDQVRADLDEARTRRPNPPEDTRADLAGDAD